MVQPCHSLVPQQLFADPCSMLENTEQDSKSCCTSSATRPRFDIDTNRRIASAPLRFNLLTRLMNKPPDSRSGTWRSPRARQEGPAVHAALPADVQQGSVPA